MKKGAHGNATRLALTFSLAAHYCLAGLPSRQEFFARVALSDRQEYVLGRRILERQPNDWLNWLLQKSASADWRERDLARVLVMNLQSPAEVAAIRAALSLRQVDLVLQEDRSAVIRFRPGATEEADALKLRLPEKREILLDQRSVPVVIDFVRGANEIETRSLRLAGHLADPDAVPALLHMALFSLFGDQFQEALVAIGTPALPSLVEAIRKCPERMPPDDFHSSPLERDFAWESRRRGLVAIGAVGALRDLQALPLLHEKLGKSAERELVVKLADALGQIGSPESARPLFERLVSSITRGGRWPEIHTYNELRTLLLNSSIISDKLLVKWSNEGRTPIERVVAKALFALRGPSTLSFDILADSPDWTTMPVPLLFERAVVLHEATALNRLPKHMKEGPAFELISAALARATSTSDRDYGSQMVFALVETRDSRCAPVLRSLLTERPPAYIDSISPACLLLETSEAATVWDELIRRAEGGNAGYAAAAEAARVIRAAFASGSNSVASLLDQSSASFRLGIARALSRRGDPRAVSVLLRAAAAKTNGAHVGLCDEIMDMGKSALEPLSRLQSEMTTNEWKLRLLSEALLLQLRRPDLVRHLYDPTNSRPPGFMKRSGPSLADLEFAGRRLATSVGRDAIPLLEAALVFENRSLNPSVLIFALAALKEERSMPIVRAAASQVGTNLATIALNEFNAKDPNREDLKSAPPPKHAGGNSRAPKNAPASQRFPLPQDSAPKPASKPASSAQELQRLHVILQQAPQVGARIKAAASLAKHGYQPAFDDIEQLFMHMIDDGIWSPDYSDDCLTILAEALLRLDRTRAFPLLSVASFYIEDQKSRRAVVGALCNAELTDPTVRDTFVALPRRTNSVVAPEPGDIPRLRFLEMCDLWAKATIGADQHMSIAEDVREHLLAGGEDALGALVELSYSTKRLPTREEVAKAVHELDDRGSASAPIVTLALGLYPKGWLDEPSAGEPAESLLHRRATAIRNWRLTGPWFLDSGERGRLLIAGTLMLERYWPIESLRAFAIRNLDRLSRIDAIEKGWSERLFELLLASIRYSADSTERDLLAKFATQATPNAAKSARWVMVHGVGYSDPLKAEHWNRLPAHAYDPQTRK